jgi:antirestriction protein ArdC
MESGFDAGDGPWRIGVLAMLHSAPQQKRLNPAERVTADIKAALERGVRPWARPWETNATLMLPRRANGIPYKGINTIALWATSQQRGYASPYWLTFKQAIALNASVRKGERGSFVVFYSEKRGEPRQDASPEDDRADMRRILRGYTVFSAEQIVGLPENFHAAAPPTAPLAERESELISLAERIPAEVRHGGDRAFYSPDSDVIQLPHRGAFTDFGAYFITRLHETAHWTRPSSRLNRDFGQKRFGDSGYALEEVVAELCAAMLGAELQVPGAHIDDHAGYLASWLRVLDEQPSAFLTAAGKAQQAADYLMGLMGLSAPPDPG